MIEIVHGDALRILPGLGLFDAVVTDPPYSAGAIRPEWKSGGSVDAALYEAAKHVAPGGLMLVFSAASGRSIARTVSAVEAVLPFARVVTWCKPFTNSRAMVGPWGWASVPILVFGRLGGAMRAKDHIVVDGIGTGRGRRGSGHPAELPPEIGHWIRDALAERATTVLDPFCGTGSLLIPWNEGTGIEINETWAAEARRRIANKREDDALGTDLFSTGIRSGTQTDPKVRSEG